MQKLEKKMKRFYVITIVMSILFGGLTGGGVVFLYKEYLDRGTDYQTPIDYIDQYYYSSDMSAMDVVDKSSGAVVSIVEKNNIAISDNKYFTDTNGGTGFVITSDGLILTNKHVVNNMSADYAVITSDGKSYPAKIASIDPLNDLAIIKAEANGLPVVELGDSTTLKVGQMVVAIGNVLNEYQNTVTTGVVSAVDRTIGLNAGQGSNADKLENMIQTDAAINPGNSGGPLFNMKGQVVGINTATDVQAMGVGFAIPINQAKSAIDSVIKLGKIVRPHLGIKYIPITPEFAALYGIEIKYGAMIYDGNDGQSAITKDGPADKAGLKVNDIIVSINSEEIDSKHTLLALLQQYLPNDEIEILYYRDGEKFTTRVILDEMQ